MLFEGILSEDWDEGATVTEHPVETGANIADHVRVTLPKCELKIRLSNEPIQFASPDGDRAVFPTTVSVQTPDIAPPNISPTNVTFNEWQNLILERALAATAGGAVGGVVGGTTGGAIGAIGVGALTSLLFAPRSVPTAAQVSTFGGAGTKLTTQVQAQLAQWPGTDFVKKTHDLLCEMKNNAQLFFVNGSKQTEDSMVIEALTFHRDNETGTGEDVTIGLKKVRFVSTKTVALPIANLAGGGPNPPVSHGEQEPSAPPPSTGVVIIKALGALGGL
jgi:hypothetical protein